MQSQILLGSFLVGIISILYALYLGSKIKKYDPGTEKMQEISEHIHKGAMAFLNREYKIMFIFMVIVAALLYFAIPEHGILQAIGFIAGSILSAVAGRIGMHVATKANVRTAWACDTDIRKGFKIAFSSGVVMGMFIVGLAVLGIASFHYIFSALYPNSYNPNWLFGFGFGASYIALFARVGGGIYTKAADVGADLVGKVEKGIPEDDPRNPAVIADNVGDNVGDVAGMGADLLESYIESILAAMVIGFLAFSVNRENYILLP
ncbi:MAG: sodium/proton-translocating pyrophosphatase, partial [Nanoarchaeota archaeon]